MAPRTPSTTVAGHIAVIDGIPTTTTQDIAEVYGKQHAKVLAIVRQRMAEAGEWGVANFGETTYTNPQNGQTYPVIRMTKKGFHFVVGKFTGAKAVAHQIAYADEFERMEAALNSGQRDQLTNTQKQHLRELVDIIAATGKQTHAETWARLHRKFHVPSYHALPPSEFERAVGYLHGKLDTESIGALVQKHCAPLLPAPMARMDVTPEQLIKKWAEPGNYPFDVDFMHHIVQVFTERIFSAYQFQRSRANGSVNRW